MLFSCFLFSCDNSDTSENITTELNFSIKETTLDTGLSEPLGYNELTVKAGKYSIDYCEENFGSVSLELNKLVKNSYKSKPLENGFGVRIRIATVKTNCTRGIGY
jgi:hypothetical protein